MAAAHRLLSARHSLCPLPGCSGALAKECLSLYPACHVTVFDIPEVVRTARKHFPFQEEERISFHEGGFLFVGCVCPRDHGKGRENAPCSRSEGGTGPGHCLDLSLVFTETSVTITSWGGLGKAWSAQVTRRAWCSLRPMASGRRLTQALPCITGDFFKDPLPDADLYILARVLHDWADDKCSQLLARIGQACKPGGWCDGGSSCCPLRPPILGVRGDVGTAVRTAAP